MSNIAELRKKAGLRQRDLADLTGFTESSIRNLERNRNGIAYIERIAKLCTALNCSVQDLIRYEEIDDGEA